MKKRIALTLTAAIVVLVAIVPLQGSVAGVQSMSKTMAPELQPKTIPDLCTLINYPYEATVQEVTDPTLRANIITELMGRPETAMLMGEMGAKGFVFDPVGQAEVMIANIHNPDGTTTEVHGLTMKSISAQGLSGALTAMQPTTPGAVGFYQAHHTNLDPDLAEVPDPVIVFNGEPYFYITTLRWIGGRIVYWRYWWFDSHNHPNWYYAHYYWYWRYYLWYGWVWNDWYWWVYGWYYWRYWYFWSTYFPWIGGVCWP